MELWLLGAGALVLVALTLWIVWPARIVETDAAAVLEKEALKPLVTESIDPHMPPQGDRFEDQYTSVTADLSPGGVMAALQSMQDRDSPPVVSAASSGASPEMLSSKHSPVTPYPASTPGASSQPPSAAPAEIWPEASTAGETIGQPSNSDNFPYADATSDTPLYAQPRTIGLGVGALLSVAGAVGGAWLYARWQRERNKPINRLRRSLRDAASQLGERLPDELPGGAAPMGGTAGAVLLASFLAARALRRDSDGDAVAEVVPGRAALEAARDQARRRIPFAQIDRLPTVDQPRPAVLGIGFGGLAAAAGGAYLVWRMLRGDGTNPPPNWYPGQQRTA